MGSKDNFILGFISGLIMPIIAFAIYASINFPDSTIKEALLYYKKGNVLTHVISLSVLANLIIFFAFLNKKKEKTANGIIGGSFIYVFIVLVIMFLK